MPAVHLPYVDSALAHMDKGGPPAFWHNLHWGLYADPEAADDSPEAYVAAAAALTEHVVGTAGVDAPGGCSTSAAASAAPSTTSGPGTRAAGWRGSTSTSASCAGPGGWPGRTGRRRSWPPTGALPVRSGSQDHVLAVECVFHFPSRKAFFREAARVLAAGGTLALTDFLLAPGGMATFLAKAAELGPGDWYGHSSTPLTSAGYERLGRGTGFDLLVDEDVTPRTLPTYPARRRLYAAAGADEGVATIDRVEALATEGAWEYHVLAFRRRG